MKKAILFVALLLGVTLICLDADAARRFGGGGNLGKQRPAPTARESTTSTAPATPPSQASPASPTAAPASAAGASAAAAAPKPTFMQRWGGMLAGLGIGVLLASLFGAQMGPIVGMILAALLVFVVVFLLLRLFASRREPQAAMRTEPSMSAPRPSGFSGIGSAIPDAPAGTASISEVPKREPIAIPGFEVAPFVRVAKTSFIRLQAANDSGDLDDIRDYTTPEMYAEISMQLKERGPQPQKTEVVSLEADVVEAVVEDGYEIASVRFWGLMRENDAANPEPFDEIWHVRKKAGDRRAPWLIAGIQQRDAA